MMQNKSFNPVGISLFGTQAAVLQANFLAHAVKLPGGRSAKRLLQRRIQGVHTTAPKTPTKSLSQHDNNFLYNPHDGFLSVN